MRFGLNAVIDRHRVSPISVLLFSSNPAHAGERTVLLGTMPSNRSARDLQATGRSPRERERGAVRTTSPSGSSTGWPVVLPPAGAATTMVPRQEKRVPMVDGWSFLASSTADGRPGGVAPGLRGCASVEPEDKAVHARSKHAHPPQSGQPRRHTRAHVRIRHGSD